MDHMQTEANRTPSGTDASIWDIIAEYRDAPPEEDAPEAKAAPAQKSSLPSEDEVRAYLADYAKQHAGAHEAKPAPEDDGIDPRFLMGKDRIHTGSYRYGSHSVDTGMAENYEPPAAAEAISSYSPERDSETPDPEPGDALSRLPLLGRLKNKVETQRLAGAKREAARRSRQPDYPEPEELILPGEEPLSEPVPVEQPDSAPAERPAPPKPSWSRSSTEHQPYASVFPDTSASPAVYAMAEDEEDEPQDSLPGDEGEQLRKDTLFPSSFKDYLLSLVTTFFYRFRVNNSATTTVEEDDKDLGPELPVAQASRYYGRQLRSQRLRLRICGVLLLFLAWVSLGLPVTGQLNNIKVATLLCLAIQLMIMLLCLDVLTGGVLNAVRKKPGADTMAVFCCLITTLDAILSVAAEKVAAHLPLCLLSSLSLTGVLLSSFYSCRGLRKSLRVPAIAKVSYTVTGETNIKNGDVTLLKSVRPYSGFVRRSEEAPPDEALYRKLCLPMLALCLLLALIVALAKHNVRDFFYIFAVLLCPAVPISALLCFALPYFFGSALIFSSGAAVAGWSGLWDIGRSKNLIVTDRDLFPEGSVEIDSIRIVSDISPETIIAYAGSMVTACGSSVSSCFGDLMERNHCVMRKIENFETLPGGGLRGIIDSKVILCGNSDLMQLMNVRIPKRLVGSNAVLLAVDGLLYGIFNLNYKPLPEVRRALVRLMRSTRHPIFAIRDFNVTPAMLRDCFDLATDGYDFPPYVERFAMSAAAPDQDSKIAAVVCRDGLGPLTRMAETGRSMFVSVRVNLLLTVLGSVIGVFAAFFRLLNQGGVSVAFLFVFMLLWTLPVVLNSLLLRMD